MRARVLAAAPAVVALVLSGAGCTKAKTSAPAVQLRQPSDVAVFRGRTFGNEAAVRPYLVVANAARNDLTLVDAETDRAVASPIRLRSLVLPVGNRPSLLAAAPLGDDGTPGDPTTGKPDLLVAVSGGDSVLQVIETWNASNKVHDDPLEAPALAVDLGSDVLALAAVPSDAGTARIAAVLAGTAAAPAGRIAIVEWRRVASSEAGAIELAGTTSADLGFTPLAIAAMPDDPAVAGVQTELYVATLDPIGGVFGVAQIAADLSNAGGPTVLGARGPTRLVAAARLKEMNPGSAANGPAAFPADPAPPVPRVYAVLDESGCGPSKPIDCGVVTLDPALAGAQSIPVDDQFMPYRAPMRVIGRPLTIAVSGPTAKPPVDAAGPLADYTAPYMRLHMGPVPRSTTAVAAVASDDGNVYFLDLGRFESTTGVPVVSSKSVSSFPITGSPFTRPCDDANAEECKPRRLWVKNGAEFAVDATALPAAVTLTPGFSRDQRWTLTYQGELSPDLARRGAEAGESSPGTPWLALQVGDGPAGGTRILNEVVRLWDPAFGIRTGDVVVLKARAVGGACEGTAPASTADTANEFEVEVAADPLPPTAAYPGGAVALRAHVSTDPVTATATAKTAAWATCFTELTQKASGANLVTGLIATFRAGGYVLVGGVLPNIAGSVAVGYVGRPTMNGTGGSVDLTYVDESALVCPIASYEWPFENPAPPTCDPTCREGCEQLAIVRKLRRIQGVSVDCDTDPAAGRKDACLAAWQGNASTTDAPTSPPGPDPVKPDFPLVKSPVALAFTFDVQRAPTETTGSIDPFRGLTLTLDTGGNTQPIRARGPSTAPYHASGAISFDRTPWTADPVAGYRFFVSYPADFVLDTTPSIASPPGIVIR